jgi:hypothetical protein
MSRYDELNERISARFVPDEPLRPNFDPIPISTKYYDVRGQTTQPRDLANYNDDPAFFPTNARGPITRFVQAIQLDTELRGQDRNTYRQFIPAMYPKHTGYADATTPNLANYKAPIPSIVGSAIEFNISTSRRAGATYGFPLLDRRAVRCAGGARPPSLTGN